MLELTALESRKSLDHAVPVAIGALGATWPTPRRRRRRRAGCASMSSAATSPVVDGDAFLLQRAVANLVDNALDFSPAGGTVRIEVGGARAQLRHRRPRPAGPAFPSTPRTRSSRSSIRCRGPATAKKSTGLGLSFVKEIAELHRGRVTLKNAADGGAVATFRCRSATARWPTPAA